MKKRIAVLTAFILLPSLTLRAHEQPIISLCEANKKQTQEHKPKPQENLKQTVAQKKELTRYSPILGAIYTGLWAYVSYLGTEASCEKVHDHYKKSNYIRMVAFSASVVWQAGVTLIIGGSSLMFVRKAITGPEIDDE